MKNLYKKVFMARLQYFIYRKTRNKSEIYMSTCTAFIWYVILRAKWEKPILPQPFSVTMITALSPDFLFNIKGF